jgi:hypothetical protein
VSLPPTVPAPPNTIVQVQPGMNVQAVCMITPPAGALMLTSAAPPTVAVAVQPGMAVKAIVLVTSTGAFASY